MPHRRTVAVLAALAACTPTSPPASDPTTTDTPSTGPEPTTGAPTGTNTGDIATTTVDTDVDTTTGSSACAGLLCGAPAGCCPADAACVAAACAPACASGVRCGDDPATCCAAGEVCVAAACTAPGDPCDAAADCPAGSYCEPILARCVPVPDPLTCGHPQADLALALEWSHEDDEVTTMPLVVDLDGDGVPEVVVNSMRAHDDPADPASGELIALDGVTGAELWRVPHDPRAGKFGAHGRSTLGAGDVSGDGLPDIVYPGRPDPDNFVSRIHAVDGAGVLLWTARNPDDTPAEIRVMYGAPALANLDDDPMAEIAYGAAVLDHDGLLVWDQGGNGGVLGSPHAANMPNLLLYSGGLGTFADLTGDGYPELVTGNTAFTIDWTAGDPPSVTLAQLWKDTSGSAGDGWPAVADLDGNGTPEVVLVAWPEIKILDGATGKLWCGVDPSGAACSGDDAARTQPISVPGGNLGGPATIADFDGDGRPEFGLTTGSAYHVFDLHRAGEAIVKPANDPMPKPGAFYTRWRQAVQDMSSAATGASAFDLDADGDAEVFYQDECRLRLYDGASGESLLELANSSVTIHEYPVLRDVDADGATELLLVANQSEPTPNAMCAEDPSWTPRQGVYLYRPASGAWAPTGVPWTMHTHHTTDVGPDGNPPASEQSHWTVPGLNGFRESEAGALAPNAPDLAADLAVDLAACPDTHRLRATIHNVGAIGVPAGVTVRFHAGTDEGGPQIAEAVTAAPLVPGGFTTVEAIVVAPPPGEPANYFVAVDPDALVAECFEANNGALVSAAACPP